MFSIRKFRARVSLPVLNSDPAAVSPEANGFPRFSDKDEVLVILMTALQKGSEPTHDNHYSE